MEPHKHLIVRASSLSRFPDCPRRWAASALWKEITDAGYSLRPYVQGIGASVGISVHKAAQTVMTEKAASGTLPPASVATDAATDTIKEEIARGTQFDERITPNANDARLQVVRMALSYHHQVAPGINPLVIEQRFDAIVPWSTQQIVLSGMPDIVAQEPGMIDDIKSGSRLGYHIPQIGAYSMAVRSNGIMNIEKARLSWVPRVTMKKPQPDPIDHQIDLVQGEGAATNILRAIDTAVQTWREGDEQRGLLPGDPSAFIANPNSMLCSSRWCRCHSAGPNGFCREYEGA